MSKSFKTDCNHCFHEQCIKGWIKHDKKSCPNCRHPINQKMLDELNVSHEKKIDNQINYINTQSPEYRQLHSFSQIMGHLNSHGITCSMRREKCNFYP
jgi:hypothetical protein